MSFIASVGRREYTVTVNKGEPSQDYAKALAAGLASTTIKDYARSVMKRAAELDKQNDSCKNPC